MTRGTRWRMAISRTGPALDKERVGFSVEDPAIETDDFRIGERQIEILQDFGKPEAKTTLAVYTTKFMTIQEGIPCNIVNPLATIRSVDIGELGRCARGVQSQESVPVIVLPFLIACDAIRIEDALRRLRVVAV